MQLSTPIAEWAVVMPSGRKVETIDIFSSFSPNIFLQSTEVSWRWQQLATVIQRILARGVDVDVDYIYYKF